MVYGSTHTTSHLFWYHTLVGGAALFVAGPISAWLMRRSAHTVEVPMIERAPAEVLP